MSRRLRFLVTEHYTNRQASIIPREQFGFLPQKSCEQAVCMVTNFVRDAWKKDEHPSAVFLDVSGAYDNVLHKILIRQLRIRGVPEYLARWIRSFLLEREVVLSWDGKSKSIRIYCGIPQGSPLSPILNLFYNAPAIDIARHSSGCVISFADDITLLMKGASIKGNCENLKQLIDTLNDKWCTPFQQKLELSKSAVIHFLHERKTMPEDEVKIALGTIQATLKHRLLGVEIDYKLSFHGHLQNVTSKLNRLSGVLRRLGATNWSMNCSTRRLLEFIPTLTFRSSPMSRNPA